jgi:pimeloyl-ACP methyl ester carboxylesterase
MKTSQIALRAPAALLLALLAACSAPIPAPVQAPQVKPPAAPPALALPTAAPALPAGVPALPTLAPAPVLPTAVPPLIAADQRLFDGRVDIGGRSLALTCHGTGEPAVLFEEGLLEFVGETWPSFNPAQMNVTRLCNYIRANAYANAFATVDAKSDPVSARRTALDQVEDARLMMKAAGLKPPYILVSNGYGAMIDVLYAAKYPREVAGLILIEPDGPGLYQNMAKLAPAKTEEESLWVTLYRAFWENRAQARYADYVYKADEMIDVTASEALVSGVKTLGELPVVILHRKEMGVLAVYPEGRPPEPDYFPRMTAAWRAGIAFYEKLSSKTTVVELDGTFFPEFRPALIDALKKMGATPR